MSSAPSNDSMSNLAWKHTIDAACIACQRIVLIACVLSVAAQKVQSDDIPTFKSTVKLTAPAAKDQDDLCLWIHPGDASKSTVIVSDKTAGLVFVYDLKGNLLQSIAVAKSGNIDIRQNVMFDGASVDLVVVNQRSDGFRLVVFKVVQETRMLERIDDNCLTDANYGGCLYLSQKNNDVYFVCTSDTGTVGQYELKGNGHGRVTATKVRELKVGKCEGAVADDETGSLFIGEERKGVWKFEAEPDGLTTGTLVAKVGDNGLKGDVEGLALCQVKDGEKILLVSDQGNSRVAAYEANIPHAFISFFQIEGAGEGDGIEVYPVSLDAAFPDGVFVSHNGLDPARICLTPWGQIESDLRQSMSLNKTKGKTAAP